MKEEPATNIPSLLQNWYHNEQITSTDNPLLTFHHYFKTDIIMKRSPVLADEFEAKVITHKLGYVQY